MGKPWNPPAATIAVWKAYVEREAKKGYKGAWMAIPAPKPSYPAFVKFAEKQWGPSPLQRARRGETNGLTRVQPIVTAPPVPIVSPVRNSDRAIALINEALKDDREPWEMIGKVRGILAMLGVAK